MKLKPNEMIGIWKQGKFIGKVKNALEVRNLITIEESVYDLVLSGNASKKGYTFDIVEAK
jgi:hypothetical protein